MARPRDPRRDEAKAIWINSGKSMKLVDIADLLGVTSSAIRKWKSQDKWDNELKESAPNEKRSVTKQGGAPKGNKNAIGNKGGGPYGNQKARTNGFFQKIFPKDALEIVEELNVKSPADMMWENIVIQYTAIARAQKLMFVTDQEDHTSMLKKEQHSEKGTMEEYEIQFAWDKHANFLNAQSRAIATLQNLIKRFEEMVTDADERKLKLELMKVDIDKKKLETKALSGDDTEDSKEVIKSFIEATKPNQEAMNDVFGEDDED